MGGAGAGYSLDSKNANEGTSSVRSVYQYDAAFQVGSGAFKTGGQSASQGDAPGTNIWLIVAGAAAFMFMFVLVLVKR